MVDKDLWTLNIMNFMESIKLIVLVGQDNKLARMESPDYEQEVIKQGFKSGMNSFGLLSTGQLVNSFFEDLLKKSLTKKYTELEELIWENANLSDWVKMTDEQKYIILSTFVETFSMKGLKRLLEKGLDIPERSKMQYSIEMDMAMEGHMYFFELLEEYQPAFKFNKLYETPDGTHLNIVECIEQYPNSMANNPRGVEQVKNWLKTKMLEQQLQAELPVNPVSTTKMKI